MIKIVSLTLLFGSTLALANPAQLPVAPTEGTPSRALQQAKRVASMENEGDLPSRAVWLGQRVARQTRLASVEEAKPAKRKARK